MSIEQVLSFFLGLSFDPGLQERNQKRAEGELNGVINQQWDNDEASESSFLSLCLAVNQCQESDSNSKSLLGTAEENGDDISTIEAEPSPQGQAVVAPSLPTPASTLLIRVSISLSSFVGVIVESRDLDVVRSSHQEEPDQEVEENEDEDHQAADEDQEAPAQVREGLREGVAEGEVDDGDDPNVVEQGPGEETSDRGPVATPGGWEDRLGSPWSNVAVEEEPEELADDHGQQDDQEQVEEERREGSKRELVGRRHCPQENEQQRSHHDANGVAEDRIEQCRGRVAPTGSGHENVGGVGRWNTRHERQA